MKHGRGYKKMTWLVNDCHFYTILLYYESIFGCFCYLDLPHRNKPADMAWSLLQKLVYDNELENSTRIRKSVVNKLLSLNAFVPQWLYNDYKVRIILKILPYNSDVLTNFVCVYSWPIAENCCIYL